MSAPHNPACLGFGVSVHLQEPESLQINHRQGVYLGPRAMS